MSETVLAPAVSETVAVTVAYVSQLPVDGIDWLATAFSPFTYTRRVASPAPAA